LADLDDLDIDFDARVRRGLNPWVVVGVLTLLAWLVVFLSWLLGGGVFA